MLDQTYMLHTCYMRDTRFGAFVKTQVFQIYLANFQLCELPKRVQLHPVAANGDAA